MACAAASPEKWTSSQADAHTFGPETMFKLRQFALHPISLLMAATMLSACDQGSEPSSAQLDARLHAAQQNLEQALASLDSAERRISAMLQEQTRNQRTLAEHTASVARLGQRNRELEQRLAMARERATRNENLARTLRQQRDQDIRGLQALGHERRALHQNLARANGEIRRLQARQVPDHRRLAELHERTTLAAREIDGLRRYNGYLLQERGNLQAWLEEANAAREQLQSALVRAQQEAMNYQSAQADAEAAQRRLGTRLERALAELATLERDRAALEVEIASLRAATNEAATSRNGRKETSENARAGTVTSDADRLRTTSDSQTAAAAHADPMALRAELDDARHTIARLRTARDYLVEKVEACTSGGPSAPASRMIPDVRGALRAALSGTSTARPIRAGFTVTPRQSRPAARSRGAARLVKVANEEVEPAKGSRHEKQLNETRQKLKKVERDNAALAKNLQALESECAQVREKVQTLTWANEVLVKELDTAYASGGTSGGDSLPKGARGMYVLRQGESLSRVAKAFYGDSGRWMDIVEANKDKIPDPDKVKAGTVIVIPE